MGGLLELYPAEGEVVRFVGWCAGGVIGLGGDGALVWKIFFGHAGRVSVDGLRFTVNGLTFDLDSGSPSPRV
jgi:hypothetical protein